MDLVIIVVGATGAVGGVAARRAAAAGHVLGLSRSGPPVGVETGDVEHVRSDARHVDLGLPRDVADQARRITSGIVVCTGPVDIDSTPRALDAAHLGPLRRAIEFAESCSEAPTLVYVSSIFATGEQVGPQRADVLPATPSLRNGYELVKYRGEACVRAWDGPGYVVRPGHVVGGDGPPSVFGALALIELIAAGMPLVIDRSARYWTSSASTVAEVVAHLLQVRPERRSTFAVDPDSPTLGEVIDAIALRAGLPARTLPATRLTRALLAATPWGRLGLTEIGKLSAYAQRRTDLDLSGQATMFATAGIVAESRSELADAIDHVVTARRKMARF